MRLPWLAEVGELTFRHADFDPGFQILDPRSDGDGRFRAHSAQQPIANVERAVPAFQLNGTLLLVDLADRCHANQRTQPLDLSLTLLRTPGVLLKLHLEQSR